MKRKTIYDVANEAGVSISSVSRVINGNGYVSEEMRKKVEEAIGSYRPIASAREIQTQKSMTIAVIFTNDINYIFMNATYLNILAAIVSVSKNAGYRIMININEDGEYESSYSLYQECKVDGYIIVGSQKDSKLVEVLLENEVPFVLIGDHYEGREDVCQVEVDDENSVYETVKYLVQLGHKRIGIITGSLVYASSAKRLDGYLKALKESGIEINDNYIESCETYKEIMVENLAKKMLLQSEPVTAIFAFNDSFAVSVYKAASSLGIKIPEDLSVIGFDDTIIASYIQPKLTSVWQPSYEKAEKATKLLIEALNNNVLPKGKTTLKCVTIYRDSCAEPKD